MRVGGFTILDSVNSEVIDHIQALTGSIHFLCAAFQNVQLNNPLNNEIPVNKYNQPEGLKLPSLT